MLCINSKCPSIFLSLIIFGPRQNSDELQKLLWLKQINSIILFRNRWGKRMKKSFKQICRTTKYFICIISIIFTTHTIVKKLTKSCKNMKIMVVRTTIEYWKLERKVHSTVAITFLSFLDNICGFELIIKSYRACRICVMLVVLVLWKYITAIWAITVAVQYTKIMRGCLAVTG